MDNIQKDTEHIIQIESIAFEGVGVTRINNFVVFIPFTLPKEKVKIKIIKVKQNYAEALPIQIIEKSPLRVTPPCPHFLKCGGCVYQHIPYKEQLDIKTKQLKELFHQITKEKFENIKKTESSPQSFNYRTKIRMKYKKVKGEYRFGFFDYYNNDLIDVPTCLIATNYINSHLTEVRTNNFEFFRKKRVKAYNLALIDNKTNIIDNIEPNKEIKTNVLDKVFYYDRNCFFQINHSIFPKLINTIKTILSSYNNSFTSLLDLYCGVGFFGILLSEMFDKILFLEENKTSCKFLEKNILENNISHKSITFSGKAETSKSKIKEDVNVILMDPPRTGSTPDTIDYLCKLNPEIVIYISCNPATQFRDYLEFKKNNYLLKEIHPFDFFPQTKHIETIAIFNKKK